MRSMPHGAGPRSNDHLLAADLPAGCIVLIHGGATGECPIATLLVVDSDGQLLPMNQVFADRMAPVHVAPVPSVGIVLKVKVSLTSGQRGLYVALVAGL